MFFNMAQLHKVVQEGQMKQLPVWLEHGDATKEQIGEVVYAWVDESGMHVLIALDLSLMRSRVVMQWISTGIFQGLSLGYTAVLDKAFNVTAKRIHELSIVRRPYHATCKIFYTGLLPSDLLERVAPGRPPRPESRSAAPECEDPPCIAPPAQVGVPDALAAAAYEHITLEPPPRGDVHVGS